MRKMFGNDCRFSKIWQDGGDSVGELDAQKGEFWNEK